MRHGGSPAKAVGALVRGSRAGASLPAALHAGDAAHEKASAKATEYGLSKPEFLYNASDVGSDDDQDDANGGDDESKRCVNELLSRIARDPSRKHVATRVARGTRRAGRPHMRGARDIFPEPSALTVHPRSARAKSDPTRVGLKPAESFTRKKKAFPDFPLFCSFLRLASKTPRLADGSPPRRLYRAPHAIYYESIIAM